MLRRQAPREYSGDVVSSKYTPLDQVDSAYVADLEVAWVWAAFDNSNYIEPGRSPNGQPSRAERARFPDGFKATPLMVGGKLFIRTNFSGVAAIDPGPVRPCGPTIRERPRGAGRESSGLRRADSATGVMATNRVSCSALATAIWSP